MSESILSIQLESNEAFLLLSHMGYDELFGFSNPFIHSTREEIQYSLLNAEQQLLKKELLYKEDGKMVMDPIVYMILQACKHSSRVSWLNMVRNEKVKDYYYYISSQQVIELTEESTSPSPSVEFKFLGNIYKYYAKLLEKIDTPFEDCLVNHRDSISFDTHNVLVNNINASFEELESYILEDGSSRAFAEALVKGFKQNTAFGQLVYFSKTEDSWDTKGLKFLIEPNGNWLFTQHHEKGNDVVDVKCFNRDDFYQSFIDQALVASK